MSAIISLSGPDHVFEESFAGCKPTECENHVRRRIFLSGKGYGMEISQLFIHGPVADIRTLTQTSAEILYVTDHEYGATVCIGEQELHLTRGMGILKPHQTTCRFEGTSEIVVFELMQTLVQNSHLRMHTVNFDQIRPVRCPCGPSSRWKLVQVGLYVDIHRTVINGRAEPHVHRDRTIEMYYVLRAEPGTVMKVGERSFELVPGKLITVPLGMVHEVVGWATVLIVVIGGHDTSDFYEPSGDTKKFA